MQRITILHYKDRLVSNYNPHYVPDQTESKDLETISNPEISDADMKILQAENTTKKQVEDLLSRL
jgi:hypothetical protein